MATVLELDLEQESFNPPVSHLYHPQIFMLTHILQPGEQGEVCVLVQAEQMHIKTKQQSILCMLQ